VPKCALICSGWASLLLSALAILLSFVEEETMTYSHPLFSLLAYGFLYLSVVALWFPVSHQQRYWPLLLLIAVTLALLTHQMAPIGMLPVTLLALAIYGSQQNYRFMRIASNSLILILSVGLAAHLFPGFHALRLVQHAYFTKDAMPYTLSLNFDKTLVGILLLGLAQKRLSSQKEWLVMLKQMFIPMVGVIVLLIALALLLGLVRFEPKLPSCWLVWSVSNLLLVTMAEEAFFRGFLQHKLAQILKRNASGNTLAILVVSVLFGLAHYAGGGRYIFLAGVAGCGYGWIYARTQRIEASILTHFGLNLTHFLFFTYPMLA
jgi:membrane protease YdiL (CAAX protease family)